MNKRKNGENGECPACSSIAQSFSFNEYGAHYRELWGCKECQVGTTHDTTVEGIEAARKTWNSFAKNVLAEDQ